MQLKDFVKLIYQSEFGCGHFITDKNFSLKFLKEEADLAYYNPNVELFEDIGGGFERLNLSVMKDSDLAIEDINDLFVVSATKTTQTHKGFLNKLNDLKILCKNHELPFCADEVDFFEKTMKENNFLPISHSEIYRQEYKPAYRVIYSEYKRYLPVLKSINLLLKEKTNIYIAIDGRCAAGKTTLSNLLKFVYDANLICMDDFFLPLELRTKERFLEIGGNIHYERFLKEVVCNLKSKESFKYNIFDCKIMDFDGVKSINPSNVSIVEGVYSMHPKFENEYDLKIFLDIDEKEQKKRLLKRNSEIFKRFIDEFIPMEEKYFSKFNIREKCDLVIE